MSKKKNDVKEIHEIVEDKLDDMKEEFQEEIKEEIMDDLEDKVDSIAMLNSKVKELEDKILRMSAENINYRRRKDEEVARMLKYANEDIILELLPIIDNFERALNQKNLSEESKNIINGINMIYASLINLLNKFEVKEIEALNKPFDPNYHDAVMTDKNKEEKNNIVLDVMQKGYMLKDKIIRPSMVKVNQID